MALHSCTTAIFPYIKQLFAKDQHAGFRLRRTTTEEKEVSVTEYRTFLHTSALPQKNLKSSDKYHPII